MPTSVPCSKKIAWYVTYPLLSAVDTCRRYYKYKRDEMFVLHTAVLFVCLEKTNKNVFYVV